MSNPEDIKKFIQKLHWEGNHSLRDIAKAMDRSWWWIINFKKKHGLKVKSRTQSMKDKFGGHHPNWKGGKTTRYGYVQIYKPEHPNRDHNGYVPQHRLVMSEVLGRALASDEVVHHKDGNKKNNLPENLQLMTRGGRGKYHGIPKFCPKCNYELEQESSSNM